MRRSSSHVLTPGYNSNPSGRRALRCRRRADLTSDSCYDQHPSRTGKKKGLPQHISLATTHPRLNQHQPHLYHTRPVQRNGTQPHSTPSRFHKKPPGGGDADLRTTPGSQQQAPTRCDPHNSTSSATHPKRCTARRSPDSKHRLLCFHAPKQTHLEASCFGVAEGHHEAAGAPTAMESG
ncbi:hypothetical protein DQ04_09901040 [Trypanosoma grayi]|uniref:hypothetical protein n=1 Tax=Trypanosoma grayi TaxID=71804 RepID=UPI0004F44124|nr:hypothetical protein DQ04_09901040 [Trypanosoma grayi]KEG07406.1 hypothetical protein DQ04_09901040 [Trypanosoma grayi]